MAAKSPLHAAPLFLLGSSLLALSAQPGLGQSENRVDFSTQIRPLLAGYCYECHGENRATREADLRLDQQSFAFSDLGGYRAIVPGDPQESELYLRVASEFAETRMPPYAAGTELSKDQIELIRRWIEEGAEWIDDETDRETPRRSTGRRPVELPREPFSIYTHDIDEVRVSVLARGLSHPWALAFLPSGDMLVTERSGALRVWFGTASSFPSRSRGCRRT